MSINSLKIIVLPFVLLFCFQGTAQNKSIKYQTPRPEAFYINPEQTIALHAENEFDLNCIQDKPFRITGRKSGEIDYTVCLSDDSKRILLTPMKRFFLGDTITVEVKNGLFLSNLEQIEPFTFRFFIKPDETTSLLKNYLQLTDNNFAVAEPSNIAVKSTFHFPEKENNLPDDYPTPTVNFGTTHSFDNEYIFMNMVLRSHETYSNYLTILDDYGTPVYYKQVDLSSRDFRVLENGYLAFSNNDLLNPANEKYYLLDSSYVVIDSVMMGNGYNVDGHDMLLLDNGHYLMMSYDPQIVNMSLVVPGGNPNATVVGLVIQEVDTDRNVYFQWRSWDHFQITDATFDIDLTAAVIDYVHANALELDSDGNILISCRHLDEITKISFQTGNIIWRFGKNSENNMFSIQNDELGFSHQHDIRRLNNGYYTVYDNGNNHNPPTSRALRYYLNQQTMEASLDWGYQREGLYAPATGSFRQSDDGKKLICWGTHFPLNITELNSDNSLSFDLFLPDQVASYRALKFPWKTNLFSTYRELSFGNFAGYGSPKENFLYVHNKSDDTLIITSIHHHLDVYEIVTEFPFKVEPQESAVIKIKFLPTHNGEFNDRLTLNSDNSNNTERIARQLDLIGIFNDNVPSVFIEPEQGAVDVDPESWIRIVFDEPVRLLGGEEINAVDIPTLVNFRQENYLGESIDFDGTINEEKTIITLIPNQVMAENKQFFVRLKDDCIEDLDENVIQNAEISYFNTGTITKVQSSTENHFEVFPNPFSNTIWVSSRSNAFKRIELFNGSGVKVISVNQTNQIGELDTRNLPKGIYLLCITAENVIVTKKMIKY